MLDILFNRANYNYQKRVKKDVQAKRMLVKEINEFLSPQAHIYHHCRNQLVITVNLRQGGIDKCKDEIWNLLLQQFPQLHLFNREDDTFSVQMEPEGFFNG